MLSGLGLVYLLHSSSAVSAQAQIYSSNIVGYINQPFFAGTNFIANQLSHGDDSLATILASVPDGSTFTKWNSATGLFLPISTFDSGSGWSINYGLTYGEGGLFDSPTPFTNTFVGSVWPGFSDPYVPPLVTGAGELLLSSFVPIPADFFDVVGRNPLNGESVTIFNAQTQTSQTTTFLGGAWNNGDPLLAIGQSAFFNLSNLEAVPEPSTYGLIGLGLLTFPSLRKLRRKN